MGAEILGTIFIGFVLLALALMRKAHPLSFLVSHPAQPGVGVLACVHVVGSDERLEYRRV